MFATSTARASLSGITSNQVSGIKTVGVVGAGQMGTGIAKVLAATSKLNVILVDKDPKMLDKSVSFIDNLLKKDVEKKKLTEEDSKAAKALVKKTTNLRDLGTAEFVIEAATENPEFKFSIFKDLAANTPASTVLATNTSSISITKIGASSGRAQKVVGMHFFNPVPVMKLVEIIPGLATSEETTKLATELGKSMDKTPVRAVDSPGFIANRLLVPYINEAVFALHEGLGTKEDIDTTMKLGCNMPMGPLTLADFVGLDTLLAVCQVFHKELGDDKYRPSPLLVKYVEAGWLGVKTKRGFYSYDEKGQQVKS